MTVLETVLGRHVDLVTLRKLKREIDERIKNANRRNRTDRLRRRLLRADRLRETDRIVFRLTKSEVSAKDALIRLAEKKKWRATFQSVDPARGIAVPHLELTR